MDARANDAPPSNVQQLAVLEERSSPSYDLDIEALNRLIDFGREHNPRLKGASEARLAELCEVSETTFKSIRKGRNKKPRVDILYSIVSLFGGSIDRLIGLAPTRDISRERAVWDGTLVDGYQQRINSLEQQLADNETELKRLRLRVLDESTGRKAAEVRAENLEKQYTELRAEHSKLSKRQDGSHRLNVILTALLIAALIAYIIFELVYIDHGLTGALRRALGII